MALTNKDRDYLANQFRIWLGLYFGERKPDKTLPEFLTWALEEMANVDVLKRLGE